MAEIKKRVTRTCFINLVGVENITTRTVKFVRFPTLKNQSI